MADSQHPGCRTENRIWFTAYSQKVAFSVGIGSGLGIGFVLGVCMSKRHVLEVALYEVGAEWFCTQHLP